MKTATNPKPAIEDERWPAIPFDAWQDTCATLHIWTQVIGKIRLARAPMVNHWWQVPLYVTSRGLTTSPIPDNGRTFQIDFDFIAHRLMIALSDGNTETFALKPCTVADFYREVTGRLRALGIELKIWPVPIEVPDPIPFEDDNIHASYNAEQANRFWRALATADQLLKTFRARFTGKVSPVHFFWGSFDLTVTRFSGRPAPLHPSVPGTSDRITHEAYSHEVSSCGFWPGNGGFGEAAFYSYAYPQPPDFASAPLRPKDAYYAEQLGEFILPYDAVRISPDPDTAVLAFAQSTYEAAANLAKWDRMALERNGKI